MDGERATIGRPYKIKVKIVHRDNVKIACKYALFYDLFAYSVVGATSGRPPKNKRIAHIIDLFAHDITKKPPLCKGRLFRYMRKDQLHVKTIHFSACNEDITCSRSSAKHIPFCRSSEDRPISII